MNLSLTKNDTLVVKGIAIIAMLMHHVFNYGIGDSCLVDYLQSIGKVCVALFVLLSGYGMGVGYQKIEDLGGAYSHSIVTLLIRRFTKFYMNYWCIFLIFVPIGIYVFGRTLNIAYPEGQNILKCFIWDVLGLGGFYSYNITWWFNKLILLLYILSPIVSIFAKRYPIGTIVTVFLMQELKLLNGTYFLDDYLITFVIGFVWAQNAEKFTHYTNKIPQWIGIAISFTLVLVTAYCRQNRIIIGGIAWDTYLATAITLFVVALNPILKYTRVALGFLGKHSMNIYLTHTFVYYYFGANEIKSLGNPWIMLGVVTAITLFFSIVLEWIKEKLCFYKFQNNLIQKLR